MRGDARARAETAVREVFRVDATGDDGERKTAFDGEFDDGVGGLVWVHGDDVRASFEDVEEGGARLLRRYIGLFVVVVVVVCIAVFIVVLIVVLVRPLVVPIAYRREDTLVRDLDARGFVRADLVRPAAVRHQSFHAPPTLPRQLVRRSHARLVPFPHRAREIHPHVFRFSNLPPARALALALAGVGVAPRSVQSVPPPPSQPSPSHPSRIDHAHLRRLRALQHIVRERPFPPRDVHDARVAQIKRLAQPVGERAHFFVRRASSPPRARPRPRRVRRRACVVREPTRVTVPTESTSREVFTRRRARGVGIHRGGGSEWGHRSRDT